MLNFCLSNYFVFIYFLICVNIVEEEINFIILCAPVHSNNSTSFFQGGDVNFFIFYLVLSVPVVVLSLFVPKVSVINPWMKPVLCL